MHARGPTEFDFAIGDYPYKETFRGERTPLVDLDIPRTPRGRVMLGMEWASGTKRA